MRETDLAGVTRMLELAIADNFVWEIRRRSSSSR